MKSFKAMGKKEKKESVTWKGQIYMIFLCIAMAIFLSTTVLLLVGMLPTIVAFMAEGFKNKNKLLSIGSLNFAGCVPFMFELWLNGSSFSLAITLLTTPTYIIIMYASAALGYIIDWALSAFVASIMLETGKSRLRAIEKTQKTLVERWGKEVTGEIPLDQDGFAIAGSDAPPAIEKVKKEDKAAKPAN